MVVHLESGIATAACEAHNMVLAIIYNDSRLVDGDVIRPHVEDDTDLPLILHAHRQEGGKNETRSRRRDVAAKGGKLLLVSLI